MAGTENCESMCPLMMGMPNSPLVFQNVDINDEELEKIRKMMESVQGVAIAVKSDDKIPQIYPVFGRCQKERCAWWDKSWKQCAIAVITNQIKRLNRLKY